MSDLTDFLLARIAEDEAGAKDATPGPWYWEPPSGKDWTHGEESLRTSGRKMHDAAGRELEWDDSVLVGWGYDASGIEAKQADRDHIARHDPARVLAECEAKRRIVDLAFEHAATIDGEWGCCHSAEQIRDETADAILFGCPGPSEAALFLKPLASVYADHPDYREEWRP